MLFRSIGVANEAAAEIVPTSLSEPAKTAVLLNKAETVAADAEDNCKFFVRSIPAETVAEVAMLEASDVNNDADAETDPISEIDPDRLSVLLKLELVVAEADIAVDRLDAVERFAETVATVVKLPARDSINPASADTEPTSFIDPARYVVLLNEAETVVAALTDADKLSAFDIADTTTPDVAELPARDVVCDSVAEIGRAHV